MKVVKTNQKILWGKAENKVFVFRHRNKKGVLHKAFIKLTDVYKFGIAYIPIYRKRDNHFKEFKCLGYIITKNYRKFENITYGSMCKLKKLVRLYGKYAVLETELFSETKASGEIIERTGKDYIAKFNQYEKFNNLTQKISKKYSDGKKNSTNRESN
jgi:hypothetical protein